MLAVAAAKHNMESWKPPVVLRGGRRAVRTEGSTPPEVAVGARQKRVAVEAGHISCKPSLPHLHMNDHTNWLCWRRQVQFFLSRDSVATDATSRD